MDLAGQWLIEIVLGAGILIWLVICLDGIAESDPAAYVSIALPPFVAAAIALGLTITGAEAFVLLASAIAWIAAWIIAGSRIWPLWSRMVLRRWRPNSPEGRFLTAYRAFTKAWDEASSSEAYATAFRRRDELLDASTPRTRRVASGIVAVSELPYLDGVPNPLYDRALARLGEEWSRVWRSSRVQIPWVASAEDRDRPTSGSTLEFMYPELEAIFAAVPLAEQRMMVAESLRLATRQVTDERELIEEGLESIAAGTSRADLIQRIEDLATEMARQPDEHEPGSEPQSTARFPSARALDIIAGSLREDVTADDYADTLAMTVALGGDYEDASEYEELLRSTAGDTRAVSVIAAQPSEASSVPDTFRLPEQVARPGALLRLAAIGFAAASLATVAHELARPLIAGMTTLEPLIGVVGTPLLAYALLRVTVGRLGAQDVIVLVFALAASTFLFGVLLDAAWPLVDGVNSWLWPEAWADPENLLPYAPLHGLSYAVTLVAGAWLARSPRVVKNDSPRDDAISSPQPA